MGNWYMIQVRTGMEDKIVRTCNLLVNKKWLKSCFIPKYKRAKKVCGVWEVFEEKLFPGYVFVISDDVNALLDQLKQIPSLSKILEISNNAILSLNEKEVVFLKEFGKETHVVDMSIGYMEGDQLVVTNGPIKGNEHLIRKIDRHKRLAFIELTFFSKIVNVKVGLEII